MFEEFVSDFNLPECPTAITEKIKLFRDDRTLDAIFARLDENKALVLLGAGFLGMNAVKALRSHGREVAYWMDNDHAKQGTLIEGIPVLSAEELATMKGRVDLLLTNWRLYETCDQLNGLGLLDALKGMMLLADGDAASGSITWLIRRMEFSESITENRDEIERLFPLLEDECSRRVLYGVLN